MKKLTYFLIGAATLALGSCSQDEIASIGGNDDNIHITVKLPSNYSTRGTLEEDYNTGYQAVNLLYAVYDADNGNDLVLEGQGEFGTRSLSTQLNLKLATNKTYTVALFATAESGNTEEPVYEFNAVDKILSVNYENMISSGMEDNVYDCFYQVISTGKITSVNNVIEAELYRPIAQLNWGTDDLTVTDENGDTKPSAIAHSKAYGTDGQYIVTNLTVTNAYSTMNLLTGDVTGTPGKIEISGLENTATQRALDFPVEGYQYVAMQYVLAPKTSSTTYDLELNISNSLNTGVAELSNQAQVVNVPVQANFQTNIYGSLLSDDVTINVTKIAGWNIYQDGTEGDAFDVEVGVTEPEVDEPTGNYLVTSEANLKWIQEEANSGNTFSGKTFELQNDIYLTDPWTPIASGYSGISPVNYYYFSGTFNGNNKTIYNMVVNGTTDAGFFGYLVGVVNNLNFDNASVTANEFAGVVAGRVESGAGLSINGCNVSNSSVTVTTTNTSGVYSQGNKGGIIVGEVAGGEQISDCNVIDCAITGYQQIGGIAGYAYANSSFTNNTVNGLTIFINNSQNYDQFTTQDQYNANAIIGYAADGVTQDQNTSSNVTTIMTPSIGGSANSIDATVSSLEGIQAVADMVQSITGPTGNITFEDNVTINMEGSSIESLNLFRNEYDINVDFNNATFKNIVLTDEYPNVFSKAKGIIKDLTIDGLSGNLTGTGEGVGFIGVLESGSISNITISNVNISAPGYVQVGAVAGHVAEGAPVSNCNVSTGTISGNAGVGGITGTTSGNYNNCNVKDLTINSTETTAPWGTSVGYYSVGALTGGIISNSNAVFTGSITNCTVNSEEATVPVEISNFNYVWNTTSVNANPPAESE